MEEDMFDIKQKKRLMELAGLSNDGEWEEEEDEDFGIWDKITPEDINRGLLGGTSKDQHAAEIIYRWYEDEGAFDDFDTVDDFLEFIQGDIYEMLDAATDPKEIKIVKRSLARK